MKLSAIVINHGPLPTNTINSVKFADEIIIVQDGPKIVSPTAKVKVVYHPLFHDFASQRNYGLLQAKGEWVLFVDSDELVLPSLSRAIKSAIKKNTDTNGYFVKRTDYYFGQAIRHGETGHCWLLRLAKRGKGKFVRRVHERWLILGKTAKISGELKHLHHDLVTSLISKITLYGPDDAKALNQENKPFNLFRLFIYPKAKFIQNYIFRLGFLDGHLGLFHAYLMSVQSFSVRVFQWSNA